MKNKVPKKLNGGDSVPSERHKRYSEARTNKLKSKIKKEKTVVNPSGLGFKLGMTKTKSKKK